MAWHLHANKLGWLSTFSGWESNYYVATPLWVKCEDETHTPKSENLESSETPKNSELDYGNQNTLH
jgi:hypothetical protein